MVAVLLLPLPPPLLPLPPLQGFLSEAADQFAQDVVYPAFSPTVILFLLISSAYGLWKTKFQGDGREQ